MAAGRAQFPDFPQDAGIFPDVPRAWKNPRACGYDDAVSSAGVPSLSMSLRAQFIFSVVLALLFGLALEGALACWHARRSVENEMRMALAAGRHSIANSLAGLPAEGRSAYLVRLVRSFDGNRHLRVTLKDQARTVTVSHPAPPDPVPGWYRALLEIPHRADAMRLPGAASLLVATDPANEISEAWVQFRDGALLLTLVSLALLLLLHLAMTRAAGPLARLADGLERLGGGDYAARVPARGPREIARLSAAFNRMAARLGALEEANRRLNGQMLAIQEEERADLARDLHDEMGPFLFAMGVEAEAIRRAAPPHSEIARRAGAIGEALRHIQRHVRLLLKQLRPDDLAEADLAMRIGNLVTFWRRHHDAVAIHLDIGAAEASFGAEADAVIYRLVQEGLTNAARHGGARNIWIAIAGDGQKVAVTLDDDGVGLSEATGGGLGLQGMRERLAALSGRLTLAPRPGGGTRLTAAIPLAREHAA
jgi:two-component system sensor histidine kinase UhpB